MRHTAASDWNPGCPDKIVSLSWARRFCLGSMVCVWDTVAYRSYQGSKLVQVHVAPISDLTCLNLGPSFGLTSTYRPIVSMHALWFLFGITLQVSKYIIIS